jgi:hypothetical protein
MMQKIMVSKYSLIGQANKVLEKYNIRAKIFDSGYAVLKDRALESFLKIDEKERSMFVLETEITDEEYLNYFEEYNRDFRLNMPHISTTPPPPRTTPYEQSYRYMILHEKDVVEDNRDGKSMLSDFESLKKMSDKKKAVKKKSTMTNVKPLY